MSVEGNGADTEQKEPGAHLEHHEQKLVFMLVVFILVAIAIFLGVILATPVKDMMTTTSNSPTNEEMTAENFVDVPERNKEVLGLAVHKEHGRYYSHPKTSMSLYINNRSGCDERCKEYFSPYLSPNGVHIESPNGENLYLHENDIFPGDINGDGFDNVWQLARP